MKLRCVALRASVALACLSAATGAQALRINLINTGGVENGTDAFYGFSAAARYWESVLTDNVTLNFRVGFTSAGFASTTLGQTSSASGLKTTASWKTALTADATTALDQSVVTHLPNVVNANVRLNNTVQKALGLYTGAVDTIDATITFNSAKAFDFDTRDGFTGYSSDFVSVATHEMGHALGFVSAVGQNTTNASVASNADLFRYKDGAWNITYGDSPTKPYFSIDGGATEYLGNAGFSSGPDGFQTSHWREGARIFDGSTCVTLLEPQVGIMDPTGGICQIGIVTSQDLAIFDAMGWNLNQNILLNPNYAFDTKQIIQKYVDDVISQAPEPQTWGMMILGFGLVGVSARRRRPAAAKAA